MIQYTSYCQQKSDTTEWFSLKMIYTKAIFYYVNNVILEKKMLEKIKYIYFFLVCIYIYIYIYIYASPVKCVFEPSKE